MAEGADGGAREVERGVAGAGEVRQVRRELLVFFLGDAAVVAFVLQFHLLHILHNTKAHVIC